MKRFDLVIIGGGAGAFAAAIKANELGAKTVMINDGLPLGGTCVNVGCVPSKTLLWAGEVMHLAKNHSIPGIDIEIKNFDFDKVVADELALVEKMRQEKYEKVLSTLGHVDLIEGRAKFVSETEIEANGERLIADKFIIATGSTANVPPIEGIEETGYITHIEALKLEKQPKELAVIGGGAIALEFSQVFSRFGTKVTMLVRGDAVFRVGDKDLVARLLKVFEKEGITVKTNVPTKSARKEGGKKVVVYEIDGKQEEIICDEILLAAGKTANTKDLGFEKAGLEVNERKSIVVNEIFQTKNPNVFAVGDAVALPLRLETTAGREGTLACENALKDTKNKIDYDSVPYTIFTDPQLAGVGLTEDEQMKRMKTCACRTVSFTNIPKASILRRTEGAISMSIHPETTEIMGVHILSPHAGELIAEAMMLVKNKNTIGDVINSLPMFPTLSEAIKLVALSFKKDISKLSCCI
ncbi:MAG: mercury(II) reductase [Patescibacteria group bacterium]